MSTTTTTIHGEQISLFVDPRARPQVDAELEAQAEARRQAIEAGELRRLELEAQARRASKGAATSRAALARVPTELEQAVLDELEARGPGTAEQLGDRLQRSRPELSAWGPQTMSGTCNRLLRRRRIYRRHKAPGRSGRLAWVWELRGSDSLPTGHP